MKLTNEFTVAVPADRVWETLLDIERVASFLPGAKITPTDEEGVFNGSMRIKLGPMTVNYQGVARMGAVDEAARTADIAVDAKEAKGQGTASAVIRNRVIDQNGSTRVVAETELAVTGRQAQFGRGIMQDVASRMLGQFAARFEAYLLERDSDSASDTAQPRVAGDGAQAQSSPAPDAAAAEDGDALNLGSVLSQTPAARYAAASAVALGLATGVGLLLRRRRQRGTLSFHVSI
jgi:carbon monoxide dehydrogenase subunit G